MCPTTEEEIPLAPPDIWVRRKDTFGTQLLRLAALVIIIAAPLTGSSIAAGLGCVAFIVIILANNMRHTLFVRNLYGLPALRESGPEPMNTPGCTLIIPARNEEDAIEPAAQSVCALDYPVLDIVYVNDHSTDDTGEILERVKASHPRMQILLAPGIREGWLGKANAVWSAVKQSDPNKPWLAIADADVVFHPAALRKAMACAQAQELDYLTCVVHLNNGSLAEEFYMPSPWAALIQGAHYNKLNEPRTASIGIGAFVLVKRETYLACGGHAAIRNRQPEDTLLAALIRKHGGKVGVCWSSALMRVRIYRGYRQLRQFVVRKIRIQNDNSLWHLFNRCVLILLQDVLPLPIALACVAAQIGYFGFKFSLTLLAITALAAYLSHVRSMDKVRVIAYMRPALEWFHPVGALMRLQFFAIAALQIVRGRSMEWRGRDFKNA